MRFGNSFEHDIHWNGFVIDEPTMKTRIAEAAREDPQPELHLRADRKSVYERVISKNELLDIVWPGLVVEGNNLQVHISALRKLLGPMVIATIPGRGYRFTAAPDDVAPPIPMPTPAAAVSDRPPLGNLPDVIPALFGRDEDVSALMSLVEAHRLVSIVGAGSDQAKIRTNVQWVCARNLRLTAATRLRDTLRGVVELPVCAARQPEHWSKP